MKREYTKSEMKELIDQSRKAHVYVKDSLTLKNDQESDLKSFKEFMKKSKTAIVILLEM